MYIFSRKIIRKFFYGTKYTVIDLGVKKFHIPLLCSAKKIILLIILIVTLYQKDPKLVERFVYISIRSLIIYKVIKAIYFMNVYLYVR